MSNADFYNNIQKQAATMKDSYPELNQIITGQQSANKKTPQERPKKLNIQMSPNNSSNKLSITPNKIEGRSSNKITITKDSQQPNSTPQNSTTSSNPNNKNQMPRQGLSIKLDPSLIKVRSKSTDIGIHNQSISSDKKTNQEKNFPPGFLNIQSKPPENDSTMPPGFSTNKKEESNNVNDSPPGFSTNKKEESNIINDAPPGFSINKKEESNNMNDIPPGFSVAQKVESKDAKDTPPGFPINKKEESNDTKDTPPGFPINKKEEPKDVKDTPPGFPASKKEEPKDVKDTPPGFPINKKEEPKDVKDTPPGFISKEKIAKPKITPGKINISKIVSHPSKEDNKKIQNDDKKEDEKANSNKNGFQISKIVQNKTIDDSNKEINKTDNAISDSIKEPENQKETQQTSDHPPEHKERNQEQKDDYIEVEISLETQPKHQNHENQKTEPEKHEIENIQPQEKEKIEQHEPPKQQQKEQKEYLEYKENQKKTQSFEDDKKPENVEHHELKEKIEQLEHQEKEIPEEEHFDKENPDLSDQELMNQFSFDDSFDSSQFMEELRNEYEEEEEEEEEEVQERIVILPSQLVAQPLEIEKRTPISTNISIETIETFHPFACYEDLETQEDHQDSNNQYENFDSSQFPTSYGINDTIAYAFKQKGSRINVFDLNQSKLTSFQSNNLSSITAKGNVIVGSGNKELSFFKIAKETHCSRNKFDLNNATSLAADPLDQTRFFFFTENDHSLYIVRYNEFKTKKDLIAKDVLSFDLCSKYLIIISSSNGGIISCIARKEGPLSTLWERPIQSSYSSSFITNDYYIEKVGKTVTIYEAKTLNKIQTLSHIVHVFKGGGDPLFLLTNGAIIHFKNVYRFPRPVICAVANKDSVIAWYSLDYAPYAKKTTSINEKQLNFDKHTIKVMHTTIINKTMNFLKNFNSRVTQKEQLFRTIDQSINNSEKEILKFSNSINELSTIIKSMTQKASPIDGCLNQIENNQYENGFENSIKLEKNDFIQFLDDKNISSVFHLIKSINSEVDENDNENESNKIVLSDELIVKMAVKTADAINEGCIWMVDRLNILLLALNKDKRKIVIQSTKEKIQQIIQVYGANVHEENTLNRITLLNQLFTTSVE